MDRRDALKNLAAIPFAGALPSATLVTEKTRCLILTFERNCDRQSCEDYRDGVKRLLKEVGCEDLKVICMIGVNAVTIQGD